MRRGAWYIPCTASAQNFSPSFPTQISRTESIVFPPQTIPDAPCAPLVQRAPRTRAVRAAPTAFAAAPAPACCFSHSGAPTRAFACRFSPDPLQIRRSPDSTGARSVRQRPDLKRIRVCTRPAACAGHGCSPARPFHSRAEARPHRAAQSQGRSQSRARLPPCSNM